MKKYLFFAAALFTLAACNNDDNLTVDDPNAPVEIRLSSGIQVQTRTTHTLDTRLAANEEVHVWVDDAGSGVDNPNLYKNNILTVGDDRTTLSGGETMYFPSTGNAVNIYAIHGNFIDETGEEIELDNFWGTSIIHTVSQKQQSGESEKEEEGYAVSDLVYAQKTNVARPARDAVGDEKNIGLQFKHLLSKIEVVLVKGNGTPGISEVAILNTQLKAQFTPSKTEGWAVSAAGTEEENPIQIDITTTSQDIAEDNDKDNDNLNEAIIVPQTVAKDKPFIRITTDRGGVLVYALDKETKFKAGMKYRYTITANLTELTVTATIDDWDTGTDNIGNAEM